MSDKAGTKIYAVLNQKGGVGKSTVAFHLAHAAAAARKRGKPARVLCLDMDSQGNLSQYLSGDLDIVKQTKTGVGLLLEGKDFTATKTAHDGIDLLHGHKKLDRYDNDDDAHDRGFSPDMQAKLRGLGYDVIIIDTPPAVGFRHLVALFWADVVVIPMEPVATSISGFQDVLDAMDNVIGEMNPGLKWVGVVNRANMRVRSHREKDAFLRDQYGKQIVATLGTRTAVSDAMEDEPARPVWVRRGAPRELREQWLEVCTKVLAVK